jgi:hypothetical protein
MTVRRTHPPTRAMRENPDIDQLRRQARELLEAYRAQSPVFESEDEATRTHSHGGSPTNTASIKTPTQMLLGPSATSVSSIW